MQLHILNHFKKEGFTLLEVLIAVGLLATMLAAMLQSYGDLTILANTTGNHAEVQKEIRRFLLEVERNYRSQSIGFNDGVFEAEHPLEGSRWFKEVRDIEIFQNVIRKVTYRIIWKEEDQERSFESFVWIQAQTPQTLQTQE